MFYGIYCRECHIDMFFFYCGRIGRVHLAEVITPNLAPLNINAFISIFVYVLGYDDTTNYNAIKPCSVN